MTTEPEGEERINEAIAERQAALDAGQYFDDAAWLHRNATLAPALKEFLEDERRLTARVTAAVPFAGGRFGRYRLGELLGRGSMGIVYRADDERGGPTVALKLLVGCLFSDADAVAMERFRAGEARLVAGLDHPGIIPLLDSGSLAGIPYLAMPLIDGLDLGEVIRQARSESEESALVLMADAPSRFLVVASVGLQAARALVYAHEQGVVHRDIKPSNLLLNRECKVYLTDFGIARIADQPDPTTTANRPGTYRYMAPELFDSSHRRTADPRRADIYALGGGSRSMTVTIAAMAPEFDSGMNQGTDQDEMERLDNFGQGAQENPTVAQSQPTSRAQEQVSGISSGAGGPSTAGIMAPSTDPDPPWRAGANPYSGHGYYNPFVGWFGWPGDAPNAGGDDANAAAVAMFGGAIYGPTPATTLKPSPGDANVWSYDIGTFGPVNVYFYDGGHTEEDQYKAFT